MPEKIVAWQGKSRKKMKRLFLYTNGLIWDMNEKLFLSQLNFE